MDSSIRMMTPEMKFETTFWRPKPMPTPTAPERTVRAVRSMPRPDIATRTARTIRAIRRILPISTRSDGVSPSTDWMRLSMKLPSAAEVQSKTPRKMTPRITLSTDSRNVPRWIPAPSRIAATLSATPSTLAAT